MWDCIIVGGGAAGLSAGLVLGRARRRTLLVDAGAQSNLAAHGIGGLLGHDGRNPSELYDIGRRELSIYPSVEVRSGEVVAGERSDGGFVLELADGSRERTRRVLLATGMDYRPPPLPGLDQLWGRSAFHCPFCHGWEMRDQPLGVLARGQRAVHSALLLRGWSDDIVVLTDGPDDMADDDRARLDAAGIAVDERERGRTRLRQRPTDRCGVHRRNPAGADGCTRGHHTSPAVNAGRSAGSRGRRTDAGRREPDRGGRLLPNDGTWSFRRRRPERANATGGYGDRERLTRGRRSGAESDGRRVWSGRS